MPSTKLIPLSKNQFTLIDSSDFKKVNQFKWYYSEQKKGYGYAIREKTINGKQSTIRLHRFIMDCPEGMEIDHINHNTLDNRQSNLRICTREENLLNTKVYKSNKLGVKGIRRKKNRYQARIQINNNPIYLGSFISLEEAKKAYKKASEKYFGGFAYGI